MSNKRKEELIAECNALLAEAEAVLAEMKARLLLTEFASRAYSGCDILPESRAV